MSNKSFFYKDPRIYKLGLRLLHGENLDKRYVYISEQIGRQKSVLEPACGPAILPDFLKFGCTYRGFDTNRKFIKYAYENGLKVRTGDVADPNSYDKSDVVVLCDSLHHIGPEKEKSALENSLNFAKQKLIICDPFKDDYLKILPKWFPGSEMLLEKWYDYIEKDGNNQARLIYTRMRKELEDLMMEGFGIIPKSVKRDLENIGEDLIVTYHL